MNNFHQNYLFFQVSGTFIYLFLMNVFRQVFVFFLFLFFLSYVLSSFRKNSLCFFCWFRWKTTEISSIEKNLFWYIFFLKLKALFWLFLFVPSTHQPTNQQYLFCAFFSFNKFWKLQTLLVPFSIRFFLTNLCKPPKKCLKYISGFFTN